MASAGDAGGVGGRWRSHGDGAVVVVGRRARSIHVHNIVTERTAGRQPSRTPGRD